MKNVISFLLFALTGCATMDRIIQPRNPTAEERAILLQNAAAILQMQNALQPAVVTAKPITCVEYPRNRVTGQTTIVCR